MTYQICQRCVMDNRSDSSITFDENGYCNYCNRALKNKDIVYFPNDEGERKLNNLISELKEKGKGKKYDCLMGISGGLDSSYLAYLGYKWGLRVLAIHIDDGFDTELAKENIEKISKKCNIEVKTIKPDREQFNSLMRAFIYSQLPNIDTPQDNILFASLYDYAKQNGIKYFLSGGNYPLESILERVGESNAYDTVLIKDVFKQFGEGMIDKLKLISNLERLWDRYVLGIKSIRPLNYVNYNRDKAIDELKAFCGYEYYEAKHCENYYTKIVQTYWMPKKFNYDRRKSHFSSMIVSNQLDRRTAISLLEKDAWDLPNMEKDLEFVLGSLDIPGSKFDKIIANGATTQDLKISTSILYKIISRYFSHLVIKFKG